MHDSDGLKESGFAIQPPVMNSYVKWLRYIGQSKQICIVLTRYCDLWIRQLCAVYKNFNMHDSDGLKESGFAIQPPVMNSYVKWLRYIGQSKQICIVLTRYCDLWIRQLCALYKNFNMHDSDRFNECGFAIQTHVMNYYVKGLQ